MLFVQLTKSSKTLDAGKLADADQAQLRLAEFTLSKPVEQVNQLNLAEQIVLEPEHNFFVIRESR